MTFVTRLTFQSGDRTVLDDVVSSLQDTLERKGAECKGPHQKQTEDLSVPQQRRLSTDGGFEPWDYTVYGRVLEIHGSEHIARQVADREFPDSVHVEIEIEQRTMPGRQ